MTNIKTIARREHVMTSSKLGKILLAGAALGLAACGGGGGGSGLNSTPTPPPAPTPPPPPPRPPGMIPAKIFPAVTASTDFAVIGSEATGPSSPLTAAGFSVRYDAASGAYILDFPSTEPAAFYAYNTAADIDNAYYWNGVAEVHEVSVRKPSNPELPLSYTTLATYGTFEDGSVPFGWLAFGSATPVGGVPVAGSASYTAEVAGSTIDRFHYVGGTATLQFNFGAGTLSGHFDPVFLDANGHLGRYDFVNTVYGSGSTIFSGQLSTAGIAQNGTFDGQFTGPNAQELMARWNAPYVDLLTGQQSTIFGVWVGRN
jgi:hypothetical protein